MGNLAPSQGRGARAWRSDRGIHANQWAMIIDCHCHGGKGDIMTAPWNTDPPLGTYLRHPRRAGLRRTVGFPVFQSDYSIANRALARLIESLPDRLIGFAMVHAKRDAGRVRQMVREP